MKQTNPTDLSDQTRLERPDPTDRTRPTKSCYGYLVHHKSAIIRYSVDYKCHQKQKIMQQSQFHGKEPKTQNYENSQNH